MSGPVTAQDAGPAAAVAALRSGPAFEVTPSRLTEVGGLGVRRALPRRGRRTVGAWCFLDHFGPAPPAVAMGIGPHPHIGLQTVTWLLEGAVFHSDSLGSRQLIRPGQLNLMTAGRGVAHGEESSSAGSLHGVQLWVAQPEATRHGPPAFEHHGELPTMVCGSFQITVVLGALAGIRAPARVDTPLVGAELAGAGGAAVVPLDSDFEHAIVVLDGSMEVDGEVVRPGALAYLGGGRTELPLLAAEPSRALLLGGEPFAEEVLMWWNFVARTRDEIDGAQRDWEAGSDRFGVVASELARIPAPPPIWSRPR